LPTESALREAALAHLARYAATRAGLLRVLDRRIERLAHATESPKEAIAADVAAARAAARRVVDRLVQDGVLNDAAFAATRGARLLRAGRSPRAVAANLRAKGVADPAIQAEPEQVLAAALILARKRRLGPFGPEDQDRHKALAVLARAGFPQDVASHALRTDREEAEILILAFRRDPGPA
jgi:regulatory protein